VTAPTVTDRSALAASLRDLKLSGMLGTLDARLALLRWSIADARRLIE
jgi:hypothetical protein